MAKLRQLEQRHVSAEISLMEWNPMLDLIALATISGEVIVHRLSWQKVWSIPSSSTKEKTVLVTALSWRPDGKILAYAYDTGTITLCDVENSEAVHVLEVQCVVTSLNWIECAPKDDDLKPFYTDRSHEFLQKHHTCNKNYGTVSKQNEEIVDDFKKMKGQKHLNILVIGMETGVVHLHSFGMFPIGFIEMGNQSEGKNSNSRIISVTLSKDFKVLTVVLESKDESGFYKYYYRSYSVTLLNDFIEEIKIVSLKYGHISSLLAYLSSTIRAISEAWEDILLEVDTKIHNYAYQKSCLSEGSISDDFLELLMFGNPSDSLEKFLLHDLTESGLKKFGHSIELSYSNIQKLVLKRLQNVSSSLFYHLNDFRGMALWKERFGALGLDEAAIKEAVLSVGSFLLKATEIQQVIDSSMKNFKAFFRWLYSVILRLSDEQIPQEISKLTQQDLNFVAEFLKENFNFEYDENKKTTVKLERVAQYLKKEDLPFPATMNGNPWVKFLQEHPNVKDTGMIFPHYPEKSLVTLYDDLRSVIDTAVKGPWSVLKDKSSLKTSYLVCQSMQQRPPRVSHISCDETGYIYTIISNQAMPSSHFYLIREKTQDNTLEAVGLSFRGVLMMPSASNAASKDKSHQILDIKFYNKETITVLLLEDHDTDSSFPVLLQLSIKSLYSELQPLIQSPTLEGGAFSTVPIKDVSSLIEKNNSKRMENVKAGQIAVSGSRKVVCVLFSSRRQVRLFEMDADEEEEDEEAEDSAMRDSSREFSFVDERDVITLKPEPIDNDLHS
ncbi:anaphase-promoting complex subunit 4 [Parasteatoda tepidariorum]|uniref:anaphase-promoting complex subunit 4 n=1 Tax=Parasteatoda tepidariorum TaxID=114398 RepID=UPI00077F9BEC|nr:anaphase-promoting complex subunit 4 [Parasteatoda tepidariorum]XP_015905517.1 anaphase-promoting complex subunit 4 [Parasteatoda tepidariorum]XP_015905518.1 anaphase-promoting complex subunit 4 [Parasteatoda tepidariorum]